MATVEARLDEKIGQLGESIYQLLDRANSYHPTRGIAAIAGACTGAVIVGAVFGPVGAIVGGVGGAAVAARAQGYAESIRQSLP